MVKRVISFVRRPTSKHIIINTVGTYLNVLFTAFFAFLLVRILSPSEYGVFSVLFGIAIVLANIFDFGTTATIYSCLPTLIETKSRNLYRFIKSTFFYQSIFSFIVIIILLFTFPYLDRVFFKTGAPIWLLQLTLFSVLFFIWQNFALNCLFAAKRFFRANLYLNLANLGKTLIIFVLVYLKTISVGAIIFVFGIIGPLLFFIFLLFYKKDLFLILIKADVHKDDFRFKYTLTYFISSQFFNIGQRMDLFLISFFRSKAEVGYYGLSQKIILSILSTVISITQVLSPGFAQAKTKTDVNKQFKTGFLYLLIPSAIFFLLYLTPNQVFYLFFTEKFAQTANISRSLSFPYIFYCISNLPSLFLLYTVKKPRYNLIASIVYFVSVTLGCYYLIPKMGVFAPAYMISIGFFAGTLVLVFASIKEYQKLPK